MARMWVVMGDATLAAALLLAVANTGGASEAVEARLNLQKWGFAYCLAQQQGAPAAREDAARAQGAYFQRGGHDDEAAYVHLRRYIDAQMKGAKNASAVGGERLALVGCLEIYESEGYRAATRQQDAVISPEP